MVTFIGITWIVQGRVPAHVQDMAPLSHTVWLIFRRGSGGYNVKRIISLYYWCCQRQINIDYSICQALQRFPGHVRAMIIYDICCQWSIHFQQRVSQSDFLQLWDSLKITCAVGKWHLAAHIPECFPKFTLNFIDGAGQVDGEILETLWSDMDEVAGLAQAMSVAHHQETVDAYMNDNNWQKLLRIGRSVCAM